MTNTGSSEEAALLEYEGLVYKTAQKYVGLIDQDFEDICQTLRLKVLLARRAYNPARSKQSERAFVFSCVVNQVKDMRKSTVRRKNAVGGELVYMDGLADYRFKREGFDFGIANGVDTPARDAFESIYLSDHPQHDVAGGVEDDDLLIPSTLSAFELEVLALLYSDYSQVETAVRLGVKKQAVWEAVKGIRAKMADWRPDGAVEDAVEQATRAAA